MVRSFLLLLLTCVLCFNCTQKSSQAIVLDGTQKAYSRSLAPFYHGVASGDPLTDRVIIWTRVTPQQKEPLAVQWEISKTADFQEILQRGIESTDGSRDYTVKVDVARLSPGTKYYYRFKQGGKTSVVGQTKTAPSGSPEAVRLGVVSCSNYEFGYFNAFDGLVDQDLDAILHLGDYIYEYAPGTYGDTSFTRKHLPAKEIITLSDYRTRYAQYRLDKGLQNAHGRHPFILIWDDHEIANNAHQTGAQNHQPDEGDFAARKAIAKKVYYEWMPIRESKNEELYRKFVYGDLVDILMLDERFTGRNEPPKTKEEASNPRSMLGATQLKWLKKNLLASQATWKVIGNQVIFAPCDLSLVRPNSPVNLDAWDGYAHERDDIRSFLINNVIRDVIFVTGDTHASWAFEIPNDLSTYPTTGKTCAIEIATPSITSSNWNESSPDDQVIMGEQALLSSNPHLKYVNGRDHGFVILHLTPKEAKAQWFYTADIKQPKSTIRMAHEMTFKKNNLKFSE